MFEATTADGVFGLRMPDARWLSTGWNGGFSRADAAYNVSVPEGWERTDVDDYVEERRERAGFDIAGPALLTGVELQHLRGARLDSVVAYATVGLSNPAALPTTPIEVIDEPNNESVDGLTDESPPVGTVNLVVATTRNLERATLASLLGTVVEAKTATLLPTTGFSGTTSDAVIVGSDTAGEPASFAGSATAVGAAARACVRDAIRASFRSRYADREVPGSVADADHGVVTDRRADVFEL
ncbi:adenosylcobinamide amidohydrolase [Halococcus qingdaonensis]|uniref:adenosylcobinamide amidohydrolase n=1 Tax=Halococcus qingdaonensis TaxID=224402 RepID=UPI0021171C2A|nr:adenosylcobinamide amidohydrolase [Halococcus qingdaonensis]